VIYFLQSVPIIGPRKKRNKDLKRKMEAGKARTCRAFSGGKEEKNAELNRRMAGSQESL
jgi:hypothetical protein